jgi:hemerythrin
MKQTAVDWLYNNLKSHFEHDGDLLEAVQFSFNQAKEMEKEQIIDAFIECWKENMPEGYECKQSAEQYYNETFKNK